VFAMSGFLEVYRFQIRRTKDQKAPTPWGRI
jgi:hypothetical protein